MSARLRVLALGACALLWAASGGAWAATPMHAPVALVAGNGLPGYQDGDFDRAEFKGLSGLLLDDDKNLLYVADGGNAAVRLVALDQGNRVSTLIGRNGPGAADGPFSQCRLKSPAQMIWGEKSRVIYLSDAGSHQIKKLDLLAGTCATLAGAAEPGWADGRGAGAKFNNPQGLMLLHPYPKLVIADTGNAALRLLDLATGETKTIYKSSLLQKFDFQSCFINAKSELIFLCKTKPGFWRFLKKNSAALTNADLAGANPELQDLRPDCVQPLEHNITASTISGSFVYYSLQLPEFGRKSTPLQLANLYQLDKPNAVDYQVWLPPTQTGVQEASVTKTASALQDYRLYDIANGLEYHPATDQVFVSDETNHRILSIRQYRPGEFFRGTFYPPAKPAGVKRVLLFGNSLTYYIADRPVEADRNLELSDSVSKRIEYWLNVISLSKDSPTRYEVIYAGGAMFYSAPSVAYAFYNLFAVGKLQIDLVLYNYTYFDVIFDAMRYLQTPYAKGELQHHDFDPEFFLTPIQKRPMHPLGHELFNYILKHPDKVEKLVKYYPGARDITTNDNSSADVLYDEETRNLFFKLAADELLKYRQHLDDYNLKNAKHVPFVINLIPLPINLYNNEILTGFRQGLQTKPDFLGGKLKPWCAENNIGFQDTIEMARILEPTLFPLFAYKDNYHYSARTADLVAYLTASQLLEKIK